MITSQQKQFLSEILEGKPIPEDKLVYFRERLRDRLHSAILAAFQQCAKTGFKQADLADHIRKKHAQITRWFSTTSNLTLDSISDLMVGLGMDFDDSHSRRSRKRSQGKVESATRSLARDLPAIRLISMLQKLLLNRGSDCRMSLRSPHQAQAS